MVDHHFFSRQHGGSLIARVSVALIGANRILS